MKIAISVPDPVFEAAERLVQSSGVSRSKLYSQAVEDYVKKHQGEDIRQALERVYGSEPSTLDPVWERCQLEVLREEW